MPKSDTILRGTCCLGFIFLLFWTFFSIVGAIHYSKWSPKFDLTDLHLRSFNVTPSGELSYDMDILITARHFSSLRRIEQFSYEIRTSHVGKRVGSSSIPEFHPIHNKTMTLTSTQSVKGVQLGSAMGAEILQGLNKTGRVTIRFYIEGQIYTPLFLAMKKRGGWTCDLIVSPGVEFDKQIYDRMCCKRLRCLVYCRGDLFHPECCSEHAPNCCLLPWSNSSSTISSSTISICG